MRLEGSKANLRAAKSTKGRREMKSKFYALGFVFILGALILSGCGTTTAEPTTGLANPASVYCEGQGYTLEMRTGADGGQYGVCIFPDGSECEEWAFYRGQCSPAAGQAAETPETVPTEAAEEPPDEVRTARDVALAYVSGRYGEHAPGMGLIWTEERTTPEGLVGSETFEFTTGDWVVTISYPVVAPEAVVYQVVVTNATTGFRWEGEVNAVLQVTETLAPTGGRLAVGWLGNVVSLPAGSQYDDYLSLMPEGAGEVGVEGGDGSIEAEIVALRDKEEPGKYAHFWGTLMCDVPDYGGCQLVVVRVRAGMTISDPEPVEAWEGTIVSNPPGAQFDDYFILAGDFPVGHGIDSLDPAVAAQLEGLRDTGIIAQVWGQLRTGVPDAFGSQIEVTRLEIQ
jgi:putative hemolysin